MAFVSVPLNILQWRKAEKDSEYIRDSDKNNLTILTNLSNLLDSGGEATKAQFASLREAMENQFKLLKSHIDNSAKKHD